MIHQYKNNGYNIVMDVNSGSVHIVDDVVYDVIPLAEQLVSGGLRDVDTVTAAVEACQKLTYQHRGGARGGRGDSGAGCRIMSCLQKTSMKNISAISNSARL